MPPKVKVTILLLLKEGYIEVEEFVQYNSNQPTNKDQGKTSNSMRRVIIPDVLINYLQDCVSAGYVVKTDKGKQMTETAFRRMWDSYLAELNFKYGDFSKHKFKNNVKSRFAPEKIPFVIPRITPHWLRYTFVTLMYWSGVDVVTAQKQAGHADIKTTLGIYTSLDDEASEKNLTKLNAYLSCQNPVEITDKPD